MANQVPSTNSPHQIAIEQFELADEAAHMLAWLGRGPDFRRFVVHDIEAELYRQTPGAQLLTVRCNSKPDLQTSALRESSGQRAIVTGINVTFPVTVRVRASDGVIWKLDVQHNYVATNIHLQDERRQLRLNFTITGHVREA